MKNTSKHILPLLACILFCFSSPAKAQCPGGFTQAQANWDNLDFLVLSGSYTPYVSSSLVQNQKFAIGKNRFTFIHNYNSSNSLSENTEHTGESNTFGTGADVKFMGNGAITLTFAAPVQNLQFSLYDIDYGQRAAFSALNGVTNVNINLAVTTGSILTINNNNTTNPRVDAAATTAVANTSNTAAVNVTVAGPLTSITITISNTGTKTNGPPSGQEDGAFWVSDITACVSGTFPSNYYQVSRPFTGQPGYVLTVVDNKVYYTNPANGASKFLFEDLGHTNINSMAYDPYNRIIYYTYSLTATPQTERAIRRYDLNTGTLSVLNNDVYSNLGIPTYENGVTSGAAAFYDGALYLGIEGYNSGVATGRKSLVWRIDFDASQNPVNAYQVYGSDADNGTSTIHDWSDIGIKNGILYDFDGAASGADYYHYNLQTGAITQIAPSGNTPRQVSQDWNGVLYNVSNTIAVYNENGTCGTAYTITSNPAVPPAGSWGDAAEAFRPLCDFGDAPTSYEGADPVWGLAVHERDNNLRLGNSIDIEWLKRGSTAPATSDNFDDGLVYVPILHPGNTSYVVSVTVTNTTSGNATLIGWLDYNGNNVFDASEASTQVTVPTGVTNQIYNLNWPSANNSFTNGTYTYLRIRITSEANGMTTGNPTGFFANGEVEDYRVLVDNYPLKVNLLSFDASAISRNDVLLSWNSAGEENFSRFEIERSSDNLNWKSLGSVAGKGNGSSGINAYTFHDLLPLTGTSYYRLRMISFNEKESYSGVRQIKINTDLSIESIFPNPVIDKFTIMVTAGRQQQGLLSLTDISGQLVFSKPLVLTPGANRFIINAGASFPPGIYMLRITAGPEIITRKIMIN